MLQTRSTIRVDLPLTDELKLPNPESCIIRIDQEKGATDIGALCYKTRAKRKRSQPGIGSRASRDVDPESLLPNRRALILSAIRHFSELETVEGKRPATVYLKAHAFVVFLDWADENIECDSLSDPSILHDAFCSYVLHLEQQMKTGRISRVTATVRQNNALDSLVSITGWGKFHQGIRLIYGRKNDGNPTTPPDEASQERVLALCQSIFDGLSDLCLGFKPYPHAIRVPSSLGAYENNLWVFPTQKWCMPPHELDNRESLISPHWVYDYRLGTLAGVEEIAHRFGIYQHGDWQTKARSRLREAGILLKDANQKRNHWRRRSAAYIACGMFLVLFLARTAMSLAELLELRWSGEYQVGAERQGFRTIKWRAGGRKGSFEIQPKFLPDFRKYLKLRDYLLDARGKSDYLFFSSPRKRDEFCKLPGTVLTSIFNSLHRIEPRLSSLKARKWRAAKSDRLLRTTDVATTAMVLQNSEATVRKSYAAGTLSAQMEEMSELLERVSVSVSRRGASVEAKFSNTAVGGCKSHGHPVPVPDSPVEADCGSPEGCLFCKTAKYHADEVDTRKLMSCAFVIKGASHLVESHEEFQNTVGPILNRIDEIVMDISKLEPDMVRRVAKEVESGELTPFWAAKLEMLMELELFK